jgi:peptide/nickel transport system permease protein
MAMTWLVWSMPGDPVERLGNLAGVNDPISREAVAQERNLGEGWWHFFESWWDRAIQLDFGKAWTISGNVWDVGGMAGTSEISAFLMPNILSTLTLVGLALIPVIIGTIGAATRVFPARMDPLLHMAGLIPAVVFSILAMAFVTIKYGELDQTLKPDLLSINLIFGALVLGLSDGAFSGAVIGTRSLFGAENQRRYVAVGILRGERSLSNTLPNVLPALVGQLRARTLHLLSGAVVVEAILEINGLGDLLWQGALTQDLPIMLAAATCFALISAVLLVTQSLVEIGVAWHVRRGPRIRELEAAS